MKLTLMQVLIVAMTPTLAATQVPPTPAPPPKPVPAPRPLKPDFEFELLKPRLDDLRFQAEEMRFHALEMSHLDLDRVRHDTERMLSKLDIEHFKDQAMELKHLAKVDVEHVRAQAEELKHLAQIDVGDVKFHAEQAARMALLDMPMKFDPPLGLGPMGFGPQGVGPGVGRSDRFLNARPRAPWAEEDPADSLYRVAREALNRGEYRRAAQLFSEVNKKFPKSVYALDCAYWEAFARYRTGTTDDLREALKILDEKSAQFVALRNHEGNVDVQALRARVLGALAARGDGKAEEELRKNAAQSTTCDREDVSVRAEALSALAQMDIAAAMPAVKRALQRRDECTIELRRRALYVIGRQPTSETVSLLLDVAKNDTDAGIRGEAMRWLPRVAGDEAVPQLEELLKSSTDEQQQRSAVNALGSIDSERARRAIRTIIERADAGDRVRAEAIVSISRERENRSVSPEELNYLRSLYGRLETPRLKEAVLTSLSRVPTTENQQFLVAIVRNANESPSLRATALQRLGRMEAVTAAEIAKLYDVADARALREQILSALSQRKEPEGIDKMIDIAKKDTDPQIRRTAMSLIARAAQNGNERAKKFIQEFLDR